MIPLSLGNYGGGLTIATNDAPCGPQRVATDAPCGQRQVTSASSSGNPNLDPWRSNNYDAAIEFYLGRASLLNVSYFRLDIDSFVTTQTLTDGRFADSDGQIRRTVPYTRPIQGQGGKIQGVEAGAKLALSDLIQGGSFIRNFGVDANYTYAPSSQNATQRDGSKLPFVDNSKHQINVALWYQDSALQARVAWNRRSSRLTSNSAENIWVYQEPTSYIDANITYSFNDMFQVYANGSNLTGEIEKYYFRLDGQNKQRAWFNEFEPRYSIGVRVKF
jgi:TonB-dependent receptor